MTTKDKRTIKVPPPIGERFGRLVVIREVDYDILPNNKIKRKIECLCDCGNTTIKTLSDVKAGQSQSCGKSCGIPKPNKDLTGKRVGKLSVIEVSRRVKDRYILWICRCDCGNTAEIESRALRNETVYNCGKCSTMHGKISIGEIFVNSTKERATVLEILPKNRFLLEFNDEHKAKINASYTSVTTGGFKNPYYRSVCGVGYYGEGDYVAKVGGEHTKEYRHWNSMMKRCYTNQGKGRYDDIDVEEIWHNFQNFAIWCNTQKGFWEKGWVLDKDLLYSGKLKYGPDNCCFIPTELNAFVKRTSQNDLPIGVDKVHLANKTVYRAQSREVGKNVGLGCYDTIQEAFNVFHSHKKKLAKQYALKWKGKVEDRVYSALMDYRLED